MFGTTLAPLLEWRILFKSVLLKKLESKELAQPWLRNESDKPYWLSRSAFSMLAILRWFENYTNKKSIVVWIPDFFCNQSLQFIREYGYKVKFYPITNQLYPDWETCIREGKVNKPDIFILVHYFGCSSECKRARQFCDENNCVLIEDASHVLTPQYDVGLYGDFVFYSPHKIIAIPDGAILIQGPVTEVVRNLSNKDPVKIMNEVLGELPQDSPSPWPWLVKRLLQKVLPDVIWFKQDKIDDINNVGLLPMSGKSLQSNLSRRLLTAQLSRFDIFSNIRKKNHGKLMSTINSENKTLLIKDFEYTPYMIGFRFKEKKYAVKAYHLLKRNRLPVMMWPDFAPEVIANLKKYSTAVELKNTSLFLPVHQTLSCSAIKKISNVI